MLVVLAVTMVVLVVWAEVVFVVVVTAWVVLVEAGLTGWSVNKPLTR